MVFFKGAIKEKEFVGKSRVWNNKEYVYQKSARTIVLAREIRDYVKEKTKLARITDGKYDGKKIYRVWASLHVLHRRNVERYIP